MELVEIAGNPAPPGAILSVVRARDGLLLRVARWVSKPNRAGTVMILTGRAEFIEKYFETVADLLERGFDVVVFDWRGQGGSERELPNGRKGHIDDFAIYARDLGPLFEQVVRPFCPAPLFGLAHSMGGTILAAVAQAEPHLFERIVLLAPMLGIRILPMPRGLHVLAAGLDLCGLGAAFLPGGGVTSVMRKSFAGNVLTSDARRFERTADVLRAAPHLEVGDPTIGWMHAAFRAMTPLRDPDFPRRTIVPALVFSGGGDRVVDNRATEIFAHRLKAGHLIVLPAARHEILMERDEVRATFWAAFDAFIPGERADMRQATRALVS